MIIITIKYFSDTVLGLLDRHNRNNRLSKMFYRAHVAHA